MPEKFSYTRETVTYCTGLDFHDACQRHAMDDKWVRESAQQAYDVLAFWDERENNYEVFKFSTTETVEKVEPPYSSR